MRAALTALALATLALGACSDQHSMAANGKICADFKQARAAPAGASADAIAVDECARRWAYSLASSRDDADMVAEAVVGACNAPLTRWNQQALSQPGAETTSASLTTGEPTTPLAEHNSFAHARAMLYVVQARAGNCPAPPAKDGAPEGVS